MVLGTAFIYSACLAAEADAGHHWYQQNFIKQVIWYSIGIIAMVGASLIDYHTLARWSVVAYLSCIILLVAVLIPGIGTSHYGARRWIDLGPFQMQPSEFAKLAFILGLANYISRPAEEMKRTRIFFSAIGLMALPFLLIMKEPGPGLGASPNPGGPGDALCRRRALEVHADHRRQRGPFDHPDARRYCCMPHLTGRCSSFEGLPEATHPRLFRSQF